MDKERLSVIASAVLVLSTSCTAQPAKPIEIKGPIVDTPQYSRGVFRKPVNAPANTPIPKEKPSEPSVPGSDADLGNRLDQIHSDLKALDNTLRPRRDNEDK